MGKQNIGVSAGIIPYYRDEKSNQTFFLMGHPSNKPANYWLYMRGMCESWEGIEDTALREFCEESGKDVSAYKDRLVYVGMVKQREGKSVAAYALEVTPDMKGTLAPFDTSGMFSNMCCGGTVPEIDGYKWLTLEDVVKYTHETNIVFFTTIVRFEGNKAGLKPIMQKQ